MIVCNHLTVIIDMTNTYHYERLGGRQHQQQGLSASIIALLKQKRYLWTAAILLGIIVLVSVAFKDTERDVSIVLYGIDNLEWIMSSIPGTVQAT